MADEHRAAAAALPALLLVFVVDALFKCHQPPLPVAAIMDESAHAVTALLLLGALRQRPGRASVAGTLVGAVLIDVDHLPLEFGSDVLTRGTSRPYTHSLLAISGVVLIASALAGDRRRAVLGAAFGLATHLIRDMATGGVPLYWPVAASRIRVPYGIYAALLLIALGVVTWRLLRGIPDRSSRRHYRDGARRAG